MKDYLIRGSANNGDIRFFCCSTKTMVDTARQLHECTPVSIAALGRMLTAGTMMGTMLKSDDNKMTLQINGHGPAGAIVVTANNSGSVKGFIANPQVEHFVREDGKLDVGRAVGTDGNLTIIMDMGLKEPYVGQVPITNGEIAEDINMYYVASEQVPSAVALGVLVDIDYSIKAAGGFIVQLMPNATEETISKLENNLKAFPSITSLLENGLNCEDIIVKVMGDMPVTIHEKRDIQFLCDCNIEKIEKILLSLGEKELRDLIEEDGQAELVCQFCNKKYHFDKAALEGLLEYGNRKE